MKLLQNALIVIVVLVGMVSQVEAKTQRMAIPAGEFSVGGEAGHIEISAYCLDEHRNAPSGTMVTVLGAGAVTAHVTRKSKGKPETLTLAKAISAGWISFSGTGEPEGLKVVSLTGEEYWVSIDKPIALSEQSDDFSEDIEATLGWIGSRPNNSEIDGWDVWQNRYDEALKVLGEDSKYASDFFNSASFYPSKYIPAFLELSERVNRADGKLIAIAHKETGEDADDRIVLSAHSPVRIFSGPNADREIVQAYHKKGRNLEIQLAAGSLEQAAPLQEYLNDKLIESSEEYTGFLAAPIEERDQRAEKRKRVLIQTYADVSFTAAAHGLLLADPEPEGLSVTKTPELAAAAGGGGKLITSGGAIVGFADGEPPNGSSETIPANLKALIPDEPKQGLTGYVIQGKRLWTIFTSSLGAKKDRLNSAFASALAAVMGGVRRDAGPKDVVSAVKSASEFNQRAYEAYKPVGTVEIQLYLDREKMLDIRVAVIDTPDGIKMIALNERVFAH